MSAIAHAQLVLQAPQLEPRECSTALCPRGAAFLPTLCPALRRVLAEATKGDSLAISVPSVPGASIEHQAAQCLSAVTRMVPESVWLGWIHACQPTPLGRYSVWALGAQAAQGGLAVCARAPQARPDALSTPPTNDVSRGHVSSRDLPYEPF